MLFINTQQADGREQLKTLKAEVDRLTDENKRLTSENNLRRVQQNQHRTNWLKKDSLMLLLQGIIKKLEADLQMEKASSSAQLVQEMLESSREMGAQPDYDACMMTSMSIWSQ